MDLYEKLPTDIIEYVSKNLYRDFSDKIKKKIQIKKDKEFAMRLETEMKFQQINNNYIDGLNIIQEDYNYINNVYNIYTNNDNIQINNYHNYNNNNIDSDSDSEDYSDMPQLVSIDSDTEDIFN